MRAERVELELSLCIIKYLIEQLNAVRLYRVSLLYSRSARKNVLCTWSFPKNITVDLVLRIFANKTKEYLPLLRCSKKPPNRAVLPWAKPKRICCNLDRSSMGLLGKWSACFVKTWLGRPWLRLQVWDDGLWDITLLRADRIIMKLSLEIICSMVGGGGFSHGSLGRDAFVIVRNWDKGAGIDLDRTAGLGCGGCRITLEINVGHQALTQQQWEIVIGPKVDLFIEWGHHLCSGEEKWHQSKLLMTKFVAPENMSFNINRKRATRLFRKDKIPRMMAQNRKFFRTNGPFNKHGLRTPAIYSVFSQLRNFCTNKSACERIRNDVRIE